jgi:hypothetical protein
VGTSKERENPVQIAKEMLKPGGVSVRLLKQAIIETGKASRSTVSGIIFLCISIFLKHFLRIRYYC